MAQKVNDMRINVCHENFQPCWKLPFNCIKYCIHYINEASIAVLGSRLQRSSSIRWTILDVFKKGNSGSRDMQVLVQRVAFSFFPNIKWTEITCFTISPKVAHECPPGQPARKTSSNRHFYRVWPLLQGATSIAAANMQWGFAFPFWSHWKFNQF